MFYLSLDIFLTNSTCNTLLSYDYHAYCMPTNLIYIPQPLGYIVKCLGVCDIVDQHDAHGPSVVRRSNGVESLLACSVPVLQKKKQKHSK